MTYHVFNAGNILPAASLNDNFRHYSGVGSSLLPQDSSGGLRTDAGIDIGSSSNQWGAVYAAHPIYKNYPNIAYYVSFNTKPSSSNLTVTSFSYDAGLVTAYSPSHGLKESGSSSGSYGALRKNFSSVFFVGLTGNNSALNGGHTAKIIDSDTFSFTIYTTPSGALSAASGYIITIASSFNVGSVLVSSVNANYVDYIVYVYNDTIIPMEWDFRLFAFLSIGNGEYTFVPTPSSTQPVFWNVGRSACCVRIPTGVNRANLMVYGY